MTRSIPVIQTDGIKNFNASHPIHPADLIKELPLKIIEGVKVLFINMPLRESGRQHVTPEGPLLLATRLRDHFGVDVSIIDLNAYRIKDELWKSRVAKGENLPWGRHKTFQEAEHQLKEHIQTYGEPIFIGFSGKITTYRWQKEMAKIVRSILPDIFLVSGNGLATELRQHLFQYIPELDGVAHSEGDDVIVKIVHDAIVIRELGITNAINSSKLLPYYIGYINGKHRFLYAGDRPLDLDALPFADLEFIRKDVFGNPILNWYLQVPAWSINSNNSSAAPWQDEDVIPKTTSVSSRGCPFGCKYCFRGSQGERKWGTRSAKHITKQIISYSEKYGIKFMGYPDDNFAVTAQRIADLVPLLGPLKIPWGTHTRLDEIAGMIPNTQSPGKYKYEHPLRVKNMAKAGCKYIGFGPESASPKVLEAIGKGGHTLTNGMIEVPVNESRHSFPRSMIRGIQNAFRFGIHSNCTWIIGSPTETLADVQESVLFMLWQKEFYEKQGIKGDSVNSAMFTLTWYPGTTIINYERVRNELKRVFELSFMKVIGAKSSGVEYEPVFDEAFEKYMLELDDATKVLYGSNNEPLNFGDMPTDVFLQARQYIDSGQTLKILEM